MADREENTQDGNTVTANEGAVAVGGSVTGSTVTVGD
jgi:hypothetical protein